MDYEGELLSRLTGSPQLLREIGLPFSASIAAGVAEQLRAYGIVDSVKTNATSPSLWWRVSEDTPQSILDDVLRAACLQFIDVSKRDMLGTKRQLYISEARQAVWLVLHRRGASLAAIGRVFNGRDHTTVRSGYYRAEARCLVDPCYARAVRHITAAVPDTSALQYRIASGRAEQSATI